LKFFKHPLVTVIIPTFNRAHVIQKAINSVLIQNYKNFELIIIDDGSTDNTEEIVKKFHEVIYVKKNHEGQSQARNYGLFLAKGEFIASLDSDDEWNNNYLEVSIEYILNHQIDLFFSNCNYHPRNSKKYINYFQSGPFNKYSNNIFNLVEYRDFKQLLISGQSQTPSSGVILRKSFMSASWDKRVLIGDDLFLQTELIVLSPDARIGMTNQILWSKFRGDDNVSDGNESISFRHNNICDLKLLLIKLGSKLTIKEIEIIKTRILQNHIFIIFLSFYYFNYNLSSKKSMIQLSKYPLKVFYLIILGIFKYCNTYKLR
jgi:glycosyltransferase involved in cell wall biosynthesis